MISANPMIGVKRPTAERNLGSFGEVDMPEWYMAELKKFKDEWDSERDNCGDSWLGGDREYVFHKGKSKPYYTNTPSNTWSKILKKHGLRPIRLHDLRHTPGSLLFEAGEDIKSIQERLRHSDFRITADIYVHVTKKKRKQTGHQFDKFAPPSPSRPQA
jgi:integrase